jgi:UDP-3-O-[3-hydroxymyristoyl] N-acetylglucosamine deacetylase
MRQHCEDEGYDRVQTTLKSDVHFQGVGLHTGKPARIVVSPASFDTSIMFNRTDVADGEIPARWDHVAQTPLNTRLQNTSGVTLSTIEHLMAALAGCGIHNAWINVDGPEVPILDGSSAEFVRGFIGTGIAVLDKPLQAIEIVREIAVNDGNAMARLLPASTLQMDFEIDFDDAAIGYQSKTLNLSNGTFVRELCDSRTFCRQSDVDIMRAQGLAQGGSYLNAVVVAGDEVLSPGGLRHKDEAVRHKMLDALGDLATAGAPILGRYTGVRAGHALTNQLLRALFAQPDAWRWVTCDAKSAAQLPGAGVNNADLAKVA